ncbi:HpcH/HpaI aldolase family protein [Caldicoprobacter algeriensis]|uniref:HpcH/HpaI aldolase family protein n=1 Tax=Caldicoprobacter algeriensis TaxID=699281 RepID=UPI00207ABA4D|nr:aldolase/citrate lyase family protein [Caldicoprobacter algeriensis]
MKELLKSFKQKLNNGYVIDPFMKTGDPAFVEVAGYAGFDFAILDTEHGPVSIESMQNNIRAALVSGIVPIIRVQDHQEVNIAKALDIGALGVQVPQITNAEEAEKVVKAARFYPNGSRGVCRFVRAARYSAMDRYEYFRSADDNLFCS